MKEKKDTSNSTTLSEQNRLRIAVQYHEATKHHFGRYARSSGYLDWANQPNPFRRYAGTAVDLLPLPKEDASPRYDDLYSVDKITPHPAHRAAISALLECALGLSAWKAYEGTRWELRCNPSSGNLHPTEAYLIAGSASGCSEAPGVYHYAPEEHALETRTNLTDAAWASLSDGFPEETFFVGFTSIHWREAWKYGERAYRYCQLDMGHAVAALRYSAATLGWRVVSLDGLGDTAVAQILGVDRETDRGDAEPECPALLMAVVPNDHQTPVPSAISPEAIEVVANGPWIGHANCLSSEHVDWSIIDHVADACAKPKTHSGPCPPISSKTGILQAFSPCKRSARTIFQQRRSAVAMDATTSLPRNSFYRMLARVLPNPDAVPWHGTTTPARLHLGIFVHRVDGIEPGLYFLVRDPQTEQSLRDNMKTAFTWERPPECPDDLPLYLLSTGDRRNVAAMVSCHQDIAADGAFSLGMIAEFETPLRQSGAWIYPRHYWEAGMIGHVLYLEAEADGLRATGIGCFFDEAVHELFGFTGHTFQSLYHFTVGAPVDDPRLQTLPPYSQARREQG